MPILGIDYGKKKIGLAFAVSKIAEPHSVIRFKDITEAIKKITAIAKEEKVNKVIVGLSEGKMAKESQEFASALRHQLSAKVETFDETLTTHDAQQFSREVGVKRNKRKRMEDAYAAAIMLQGYLDLNA
jgi:putative Holliday junction resolvase